MRGNTVSAVGRSLWGRRTPSVRLSNRRNLSLLAWYNRKIERSPLITKSLTSGVLFALGDVLAQTVTMEKGGHYDRPRILRAAVFGAFILGPLAHTHYNFIEWLTVKKLALSGTRMVLTKMVIDQFTYWTVGINIVYLSSLPLMAGKSRTEAWDNVRNNLWPVLRVNWCVWPLVQVVNFKFVPVVHQLNFVLVVSLGWATFLSWATTSSSSTSSSTTTSSSSSSSPSSSTSSSSSSSSPSSSTSSSSSS